MVSRALPQHAGCLISKRNMGSVSLSSLASCLRRASWMWRNIRKRQKKKKIKIGAVWSKASFQEAWEEGQCFINRSSPCKSPNPNSFGFWVPVEPRVFTMLVVPDCSHTPQSLPQEHCLSVRFLFFKMLDFMFLIWSATLVLVLQET